jgi:hypothetical protein
MNLSFLSSTVVLSAALLSSGAFGQTLPPCEQLGTPEQAAPGHRFFEVTNSKGAIARRTGTNRRYCWYDIASEIYVKLSNCNRDYCGFYVDKPGRRWVYAYRASLGKPTVRMKAPD